VDYQKQTTATAKKLGKHFTVTTPQEDNVATITKQHAIS